MDEQKAEFVSEPPGVGEMLHFYPSEVMRKKYGWPDARYAAICIGTQQNKQPILRVLSPIPDKNQRRRKKGRLNLPPISIKHEGTGLSMDVGGSGGKYGVEEDGQGAAFVAQDDLTIWCCEENTWGSWERIDG